MSWYSWTPYSINTIHLFSNASLLKFHICYFIIIWKTELRLFYMWGSGVSVADGILRPVFGRLGDLFNLLPFHHYLHAWTLAFQSLITWLEVTWWNTQWTGANLPSHGLHCDQRCSQWGYPSLVGFQCINYQNTSFWVDFTEYNLLTGSKLSIIKIYHTG